ncbi:MAG TPA: PAS domain S-box protein [Pyrinomonadaceae bacterium]|nr:PAS domain S-box protein [Pyrinomonadaceae bacterium]
MIETSEQRPPEQELIKRKQEEESPLESKEHLRILIESAKDHAIYTMDADGRIDYWNTGAQALFGYTESEIIGQSAALLYTPEDREGNELEIELRQANESGSVEDERWHVRKDGTRFYASGVLTLLRDERVEAGTAHGYAMIARDLTERKAAEESIRFQAHLLDTVEQAVIGTNLDGIVIYWNKFAQQLYGWTAQEATGRHIMELTTPEVMAERALQILSRLRLGKSWTGEFNVQRRDGTTFPAQIINSPINDDKGTLIGIVGVSVDITERKRQEASLRELTRQLEQQARVFNTTLSSITDFAYIFDRAGRFVYANQALLNLWGLTLDQAVGKNFFDLRYPDDLASRLQQQIQQVFDTQQGLRDETHYTSPTGASGYYEYIFSPVFDANGTVEVVAGSTRDFTERKRVEEALRSSEAELQKSHDELERRVIERTAALTETNAVLQEEVRERRRIEAERTELLRRVIFAQEDERRRIAREMHDQFGQGLSALTLKLAALKRETGEQVKLREQLEVLEAVAKQLDADVDFLVWELRPTVLDDLGLPAALEAHAQNWSTHFGILAELHVSGLQQERLTSEIETVLYRITQEALNNTAKHSGAGKVDIILEHREGHVSLIVEDDGVGFDGAQAFGPNDKGLGLIGMRERAALVGGTAEIESQPDEGTTVFIRIPVPALPREGEHRE